MKTIAFLLLLTFSVSAQTNSLVGTNQVDLPTNRFMKIEPIWKPNQGQLACGTNFFKTTVNEFDRTIAHQVINVDEGIITSLTRTFVVGEDSHYRFMALDYSKRRPSAFDEARPAEFMVDGTRFTFADDTLVLPPKYDTTDREYRQSYHCKVSETLVRALGRAERASVRIPREGGNTDHDFDAVELRRFKLFADNFLPPEVTSLKK